MSSKKRIERFSIDGTLSFDTLLRFTLFLRNIRKNKESVKEIVIQLSSTGGLILVFQRLTRLFGGVRNDWNIRIRIEAKLAASAALFLLLSVPKEDIFLEEHSKIWLHLPEDSDPVTEQYLRETYIQCFIEIGFTREEVLKNNGIFLDIQDLVSKGIILQKNISPHFPAWKHPKRGFLYNKILVCQCVHP